MKNKWRWRNIIKAAKHNGKNLQEMFVALVTAHKIARKLLEDAK